MNSCIILYIPGTSLVSFRVYEIEVAVNGVKIKEVDLYSAFIVVPHTQALRYTNRTVLPANYTVYLPLVQIYLYAAVYYTIRNISVYITKFMKINISV